jgi:hypothetical protein
MQKGRIVIHSDKCRMYDCVQCDDDCFNTCSIGNLNKIVNAVRKYLQLNYSKTCLPCPIGVQCETLLTEMRSKIKNHGVKPKQALWFSQGRLLLLFREVAQSTSTATGAKKFQLQRLLAAVLVAAELGVRLDDLISLRFENVSVLKDTQELVVNFVKSKNSLMSGHLTHRLSTNIGCLAGYTLLSYVEEHFKGVNGRHIFTSGEHLFSGVTRETLSRNLKVFLKEGETFTFHSFRVTKARSMYLNKKSIEDIASYMGWKNLAVTRRYCGAI